MKFSPKMLAAAAVIAAQLSQAAPIPVTTGRIMATRALKQASVKPPSIEALDPRFNHSGEHDGGEQLFSRNGLSEVADSVLGDAGKGLQNDVKELGTIDGSGSALPDLTRADNNGQTAEKLLTHSPSSSVRGADLGKLPSGRDAGGYRPWSQSNNARAQEKQAMFRGSYSMPSNRFRPGANGREVINGKLNGALQQQRHDFKRLQSAPQARKQFEEHPVHQRQPKLDWNGRPVDVIPPFVPKAKLQHSMSTVSGELERTKMSKGQARKARRRNAHARAKSEGGSQDGDLEADELSKGSKEETNDVEAEPKRHVAGALSHKLFNSQELVRAEKLFQDGHILDTGYVAALEKERDERQALKQPAFHIDEYVEAHQKEMGRAHKSGMTKKQLEDVESALVDKLEKKNERYIKYLENRIRNVLEGKLLPDAKPQGPETSATDDKLTKGGTDQSQ